MISLEELSRLVGRQQEDRLAGLCGERRKYYSDMLRFAEECRSVMLEEPDSVSLKFELAAKKPEMTQQYDESKQEQSFNVRKDKKAKHQGGDVASKNGKMKGVCGMGSEKNHNHRHG